MKNLIKFAFVSFLLIILFDLSAFGIKPKSAESNKCICLAGDSARTDKTMVKNKSKCIDSCIHKGKTIRRKGKDVFIDTDGDGINDHRCSGIGLGKCKPKGKQSKKNNNK